MKIKSTYIPRPIRFVELYTIGDWKIKMYSISIHGEIVSPKNIQLAKYNLESWLDKSTIYELEKYNVATLILHEGKEGCFVIINWWIDENMLQHFVYLLDHNGDFRLFSDHGIITCVWELAVLWHERNSWVTHVLMKNEVPDLEAYLHDQLNIDL